MAETSASEAVDSDPPGPAVVQTVPSLMECQQVGPPSIRMKIVACNQHSHLDTVVSDTTGVEARAY
jgi:hypothetical protein